MSTQDHVIENSDGGKIEKVAAVTSAVIVLTGVIFWIIQIRGAMEMLELAYG